MILSLALSIVYLLLAPPIYKAECKLLVVDANKNNNDFSQSDMVLSVLGKSDPIATQIEVMKTRPLYEEVIQRCSLIVNNDTIFTSEELASHMSISVIRNSNVLSFTFLDTDPVRAAKITNTFVEAAEELNKKLNREEVRNMRIFVEKQLENQRKRLENLEQASVNFKQREKAVAIDLQIRSQIDATADLKSEIIKLEGERQGVWAKNSR